MELIYRNFELNALVPSQAGPPDTFSDPENSQKFSLDVKGFQREDAVFATAEYALGDFLITPSLRIFQQTNIDELGIDPRFALRWSRKGQAFKLGIGQYSASPQPQELSEDYGNPEISWIRSLHYTVGWEQAVLSNWTSDLQLL